MDIFIFSKLYRETSFEEIDIHRASKASNPCRPTRATRSCLHDLGLLRFYLKCINKIIFILSILNNYEKYFLFKVLGAFN